jgi:serine/threonine protein kinase/Tol biopolymer transport system component
MTPERWQQIRDVLEKALELAPGERSGYLNQACSSDPSLRQEVETLLASSDDVRTSFLQSSSGLRVTLTPGTKLGEYEVKSLLGSGGMGEVYRARDSRLGRDVAIKVLPSFFPADSNRLRRFEQEARAAAALSHPNILAVFQMGTYEGAPYMVSELLEGETLREQIRRGRLSVRRAIDYGVQIARGLTAAHEKGIVHRDLKPENLFVTKDRRVKILDFGIAKLTQAQSSSEHSAPTSSEETEPGAVMGTVGYMSPEQVRGQTADHRADIFAFGAVLYEMLAGKRAFQKPTSADTMSAILNEDPPEISQVAENIPLALQRVVHRCLEKNPEQRFQSASDLAFALDALSETLGNTEVLPNRPSRRIIKVLAVAGLLAAVVATALVFRYRASRHPEQRHELAERQLTANSAEVNNATISRDGKYLAYDDLFAKKLHLLAIDSGEIREVPLSSPYQPVDWFPDGNHLLLMSGANGGDLWKISIWDFRLRKLLGGFVTQSWVSPDGSHIAFVKDLHEVWMMGADGEEPRRVLVSDAQENVWNIAWSPTGQRVAYIRQRGTLVRPEVTIETCDLAGGGRTVVLSDPRMYSIDQRYGIAWLPDGRVIYSAHPKGVDSEIWAIRADPTTGKQNGGATRLAGWTNLRAEFPQASADGKRLIAQRSHVESAIYVGDLLGNKGFAPHRFTPDDWYNVVTHWSKDSKAILFHSKRNGRWSIFKQNIDAKTPETVITGSDNYIYPRLSAQGMLLYTTTASPDNWESSDTRFRLMSTPEKGGARSTLMMGRYEYRCGSSPSSSCVVPELNDRQLIFFHLDPVKGKGEEITRLAGYQSPRPCWDLAPDGTRLAIVDPYERKGEIRILSLEDRRVTILPVRDWKWSFLSQISWAADGKSWFVLAQSGSSIAILSLDAKGTARVLYEMPAGAGWISSLVPSPDGRSFAFTKRMYLTDVVLLENF